MFILLSVAIINDQMTIWNANPKSVQARNRHSTIYNDETHACFQWEHIQLILVLFEHCALWDHTGICLSFLLVNHHRIYVD